MSDLDYFGLLWYEDTRDQQWPATAAVRAEETQRTWRYWWPSGWWGDQGRTPRCVEYALWHAYLDGPVTKTTHGRTAKSTPWLYCEAQRRDPWEGDCDRPRYDGTSVRAGAKALRDHGYVSEFRWVFTAAELVTVVLGRGPVVVGTTWYSGMSWPDERGYVHLTGSGVGGHAYVIDGVNTERGVARIKNSWGRNWGRSGFAWITLDDLTTLMSEHWAEGCLLLAEPSA